MKKTIIAATALLALVPAAPALAEDATDTLREQVTRLTEQVEGLTDKVEHKSELLACERNNRRVLERALRTGEPVGHVARCR